MGSANRFVPRSRVLRFALAVWFFVQLLLLGFIVFTHGTGMDPDLRILSGAATAALSFPLSVPAAFAVLEVMDVVHVDNSMVRALAIWSCCLGAGLLQMVAVTWCARRIGGAFGRPMDG